VSTPAEVVPSILSADLADLRAEVREVVDAGARTVHVDVMDGHFVPALSMGPQVVSGLREHFGGLVLDVHLMVEHPERHVADFVRAGADHVLIHAEATPHVHLALQRIREQGARAGLVVNPATPLTVFEEVPVGQALVMSVNPGAGGQAFIPESLDRLRRLRKLLGPDTPIEVDGGIDARTAPGAAKAGASMLVAGSAIFGEPDPGAAFRRIADAL
jgi:ribulose-phosphate 3-epimerase